MATTEITLSLDKAVEQVRAHRLKGELKEAFNLLNQFLREHLAIPFVVKEAFVIGILTEQAPQSRILLDLLRKFQDPILHMDKGWLLAHERLTGERPLELDNPVLTGPAWTAEVGSLGGFKEFEPELGNLELSCDSGVAVFSFTWSCPACKHSQRGQSSATLDVLRLQHCTQCAAPLLLDGGALADATMTAHPELEGGSALARLDEAANALQDAVGRFDDLKVPPLCRSLNQEVVSFFNECLFRRILRP